jgi:hypothetical protein
MEKEHAPTMKIVMYGYEYTLVLSSRRSFSSHSLPEPCFMGHHGYALQSVRKLKSSEIEK